MITPRINEKYAVDNWNTAKVIREARMDAVMIRCTNIDKFKYENYE